MTDQSNVNVVLFQEEWGKEDLVHAIASSHGVFLLVLPSHGIATLSEKELKRIFSDACQSQPQRTFILATKNRNAKALAREAGWEVLDRLSQLRKLLTGNLLESEALRTFSPSFWRGQIRTQLQSLGLLSLPKIRIWALLITCALVFFFIFFKLLPSATIYVWPVEETITQTVNVYLASSGAIVPDRVRLLPLYPLIVDIERTLTFDEVGKEFTGSNAEMAITVFNESTEPFSLRNGTRLTNQAGMIFRLQEGFTIAAGSTVRVKAIADPEDLYGEIIGERGNVPAGLKWEFPGLLPDERVLVYARNDEVAVGGSTSYKSVLREEDLEVAQKKLEKELTIAARQLIDDERETKNMDGAASFVELRYEELTSIEFYDMRLPTEFVGANVTSVPVTGRIRYTILLYDEDELFRLLKSELLEMVSTEKEILEDSITKDQLVLHVIDAPWDEPKIEWVKITVDLSARQRFNLDPLSPTGARFAKQVRDATAGKSVSESESIIKNMPEVEKVDIAVWPPWSRWLPDIPSNILLNEEQ